jgi:hypothetical protein
MSSKKTPTLRARFERAWSRLAYLQPGQVSRTTPEEDQLILELSRYHAQNCREPNIHPHFACWDKGGLLKGRPWYGEDVEKARKLGLLVEEE